MRRALLLLLLSASTLIAAEPIASVAVQATSFNPAAGQTAAITIDIAAAGKIDVRVLDRDGYVVRTLASSRGVEAGRVALPWDGRDDRQRVVADEAYSVRVDWTDGRRKVTYFPADAIAEMYSVPVKYFDGLSGTLAYELPVASRVHLQAGTAAANPRTKQREGPVMKTIVNRAPRAGGAIAEPWNGYDESGTIYLPDLPDFVTAVAATPLPANAMITFGNRERTFLDTLADRSGPSLLTARRGSHRHHTGLGVLDDTSPGLTLTPRQGRWSAADRAWIVPAGEVRLDAALTGPAASAFAKHPTKLHRFVNQKPVGAPSKGNASPASISIPSLAPGVNIVSVNWQSEYGPVAASSLRLIVEGTAR